MAEGIGERQIWSWINAGILIPAWPRVGVYCLGHQELRREGRWIAAVFAAGPKALLSHRSAGALWGITRPGPRTEVIRPRSGNFRPSGFLLHQTRTLQPDQYRARNGIPLTSLPRTLADLARNESRATIESALAQAEMNGLLQLDELMRFLSEQRTGKGVKKLRAAAADLSVLSHTENNPEREFLKLVRDSGLPAPQTQVEVCGYRIDFAWPAQKLLVEFDGWRHHGTRRAFQADRRRDRKLTSHGYRVLRYTWLDLKRDPGSMVRELRQILGQR